jgi:tRNA dimethylallyltransferase
LEEITSRGRAALVVGGSGFYLKAFFAPVADEIEVSPELRQEVASLSNDEALTRLRALNPAGLGSLDVANPRRVSRALERCLASGKSVGVLRDEFREQGSAFADWDVQLVRVDREPAELERRIERRVDAMLRAGLIDEVRALLARGLKENLSAARAIGYREVIDFLEGKATEREMRDAIVRNTRALVKKQRTWFRTQLPDHRVVDAGHVTAGSLFA